MVDMDLLQARVAALTVDYVNSLPKYLTIFNALAEQLNSGSPQEAIEGMRDNAHKLSGSAGSYGFIEMGDIASKLDSTCIDAMNDDQPSSDHIDDMKSQLSMLISKLQETIETA